jgi:hypothetical protein
MNRLVRWFECGHLDAELQLVVSPLRDAAAILDGIPECAEKTAGMRHLLEAKDCFVRAKIETREPTPQT